MESLNLQEIDLEYNDAQNNKKYKIGKYGYWILCRKTANYWNDELQLPACRLRELCKNSFNCNLEFQNYLSNFYSRNDILNMLIYLSNTLATTSTLSSIEEDNTEVKFLFRQFCLINIK